MTMPEVLLPPAYTPAGTLRRSLRLVEQLDEAHRAEAQVLLTGPGVNDFLVAGGGEGRRLTAFLHEYCADRGVGYVRYSMSNGIQTFPTLPGGQRLVVRQAQAEAHPGQAFAQLLTDLRTGRTPALLVFDYADGVLDDQQMDLPIALLCEHLQALTADPAWRQHGLRLVLVDRGGGITARFSRHPGIRVVEIGPPDQAELTIFVQQAAQATVTAPLHLAPSLLPAEAGRRASGLLNTHIQELRLASSAQHPVSVEQIAARKAEAIRELSGGTLELMTDRATFDNDVAGLAAVRLAVDNAQLVGRTTLRLLFAGPPGTGKTLSATAVAAALNVPAVRYGEILDQWVGVAERNMARANQVLRAMAPLVLFIDEADQMGLGARGMTIPNSEVHRHMRAALFEFLGDTGDQSGISVVATTNVPMQIDDAGRSRFSILPVLFGSGTELAQIMMIHARRGQIPLIDDPTPVLAQYTANGGVLSGRSAVRLLELAQVEAARAGQAWVSHEHVQAAVDLWITSDWNLDAEYSTLSSLLSAQEVTSWPWVAANRLGQAYEIPRYLSPYLTPDGELELDRLEDRVRELAQARAFGGHG